MSSPTREESSDLELSARIVVRGRGGQLDADELLTLVSILTRDTALALRTSAERVTVAVGPVTS